MVFKHESDAECITGKIGELIYSNRMDFYLVKDTIDKVNRGMVERRYFQV